MKNHLKELSFLARLTFVLGDIKMVECFFWSATDCPFYLAVSYYENIACYQIFRERDFYYCSNEFASFFCIKGVTCYVKAVLLKVYWKQDFTNR